jgi:uncharacterized membrane protein
MEKLKVLFIVLTSAATGLALSLFLLALFISEDLSPLDIIIQLVIGNLQTEIPFIVPIAPLLFLTTILASFVGIVYFLVIPEIRTYYQADREMISDKVAQQIRRTLNSDERKIIEVLEAHGGTYLQKYISKEAELSRLKTHRIIARFSERGLVQVAKKGNTNEVSLTSLLT